MAMQVSGPFILYLDVLPVLHRESVHLIDDQYLD